MTILRDPNSMEDYIFISQPSRGIHRYPLAYVRRLIEEDEERTRLSQKYPAVQKASNDLDVWIKLYSKRDK